MGETLQAAVSRRALVVSNFRTSFKLAHLFKEVPTLSWNNKEGWPGNRRDLPGQHPTVRST